ncbi:class I SAM-dependent methyltransferase [Candidatus Parcubacteria bacterium]|nr:class I SAM-dependent methyltransferase [Candidatus Parcubacteria bacterium]
MIKIKKIISIIKNPVSIIGIIKNRKKWRFDVEKIEDVGLLRKKYKNYSQYVKHQASKLSRINSNTLNEYDIKYRKVLRERLKGIGLITSSMNVLCLAARIGTEVKSFIDLGCFAVGIDLNPGKSNKYVVHGDFHNIQYPNSCVDVVFNNSLDHSLEVDKLIRETKRVLKDKGLFILELCKGDSNPSGLKRNFEAIAWDDNKIIIEKIKNHGFELIINNEFNYPWSGVQFVFKKI